VRFRSRWLMAIAAASLVAGTFQAGASTSSPRAPGPEWTTAIKGSGDSVSASLDASSAGITFVTGDTGMSSDRMFLSAVGPTGEILWRRSWRPRSSRGDTWAFGTAVASASDGSSFVGGVMGLPAPVGYWFLARYGDDGSLLWRKTRPRWQTYPGRWGSGIGAIATTTDRVIVALNAQGCCDEGYMDGSLRSYTHEGKLLWSRNVEVPGVRVRNIDTVNDIAVSGGAIYIVGTVNRLPGYAAGDPTDLDVFVQKRSMDGALRWSRVFGRSGTRYRDWDCGASLAVRGRRLLVGADLHGCRGIGESLGWVGRFGLGGTLHRTWRWRGRWVGAVALARSRATYVARSDGLLKLEADGDRAWLVGVPDELFGIDVAAERARVSLITTDGTGSMLLSRYPER
jgi:hypothetical protein